MHRAGIAGAAEIAEFAIAWHVSYAQTRTVPHGTHDAPDVA
jgi:hypothetical protein